MSSQTLDFQRLSACLTSLGTATSAAEVQGMVSGLLAAGTRMTPDAGCQALLDWLDIATAAGPETLVLEQLVSEVSKGLGDTDLGFVLLLPDDETSVTQRTLALSYWCSGFLSGFGLAGRFQAADLGEDITELLADLSKIAQLDEQVPDDDENEADFIEIAEYVRMSALLIFTECTGRAVH